MTAVGPDFLKPSSWSPAAWFGFGSEEATKSAAVPASQPEWWVSFGDAELSALENGWETAFPRQQSAEAP
jgi:hypothetical protein